MPAEVKQLEQAMGDLLALLSDPASEGVNKAWERCHAAQGDLQLLLEDPSRLTESEVEDLRLGLEGLVRFNAIARQSVLRGQEALAKSLLETKQETVKMKAYGGASTKGLGDSCDLAG